jgi:hypothetical protein
MYIKEVEGYSIITPLAVPVNAALVARHVDNGACFYYLVKDAPVFFDVKFADSLLDRLRFLQMWLVPPNQCRLVLESSKSGAVGWAKEASASWINNGGVVIFCDDFQEVLEDEGKFLKKYPLYEHRIEVNDAD